jgi:hypothetical protein
MVGIKMKYYKDTETNELYAFESDGSQDNFIKENFVSVTDEEANNIRVANYQSFLNSLTYKEKRQQEYPPFTDYLDGIVKGDQTQIDKYISDCLAVKTKYPKE